MMTPAPVGHGRPDNRRVRRFAGSGHTVTRHGARPSVSATPHPLSAGPSDTPEPPPWALRIKRRGRQRPLTAAA